MGLGLLGPWILTALLFYALRRLEVWLHQHIFKVGWLVTKQYQTTTILYYAFFLPGILLNQLTVWMVAGLLNVRADRSIAWPQKQEIGELKLNFVQLSKNTDSFRTALINTAPLVIGMALIWHIANNLLNLPAFLTSLGGTGLLGDVAGAVSKLTTAPDFWLWFYIAFTISNTMMPKFHSLRGWRVVLVALAIIAVILFLVGAGNQVVVSNMSVPLTESLNALSSILAIMVGLDIVMLAILGSLESLIERITGDSATFVNGKMITMRRAEMLAQRAKALAPQPKPAKSFAAPSGPPSVYKLQFTIPGAPGRETVTRDEGLIITPDPNLSLPSPGQPAARPSTPAVISGTVAEKLPASTESKPAPQPQIRPSTPPTAPSGSPRPTSPPPNAPSKPATSPPTSTGPAAPPKPPTTTVPSPFAAPPKPAQQSPTAPPKPATPPVPSPFAAPPKPYTSPTSSPARPALTSPSPAKPPSASPFSPAPKPAVPPSKPVLDDESDDEEYDDETSYEDFEDPA